mmetsp:Transcript_5088/g.15806  ORF Transcript_5088/g.15806 Transcript_5088/m.15806 type:complete len:82 (+) Transcript_5088:251-496(+)
MSARSPAPKKPRRVSGFGVPTPTSFCKAADLMPVTAGADDEGTQVVATRPEPESPGHTLIPSPDKRPRAPAAPRAGDAVAP